MRAAEERKGGKRKRVNETRGRVEMRHQGKVGSERGLMKTGAEWK